MVCPIVPKNTHTLIREIRAANAACLPPTSVPTSRHSSMPTRPSSPSARLKRWLRRSARSRCRPSKTCWPISSRCEALRSIVLLERRLTRARIGRTGAEGQDRHQQLLLVVPERGRKGEVDTSVGSREGSGAARGSLARARDAGGSSRVWSSGLGTYVSCAKCLR